MNIWGDSISYIISLKKPMNTMNKYSLIRWPVFADHLGQNSLKHGILRKVKKQDAPWEVIHSV